MKGIRHCFLRECKAAGVKFKIGPRWQCRQTIIEIPEQKTDLELFYGFHELGHWHLHRFDTRNYDDLLTRIQIEIEADDWANRKMVEYSKKPIVSDPTLGLISLYLLRGGKFSPYSIETEDRFITLFKSIQGHKYELFSYFISNLPMHPTIY